jgi:hypothetical protein
MKTKIFLLGLFFICFSCVKNNDSISDAQKEQIKTEVKEVLNSILKGAEEANFDMIKGHWLDSSDFMFLYNGSLLDYKQTSELAKEMFGAVTNQEITLNDEKYLVIDNSTVLYTAITKCVVNFRDGSSMVQDPWAMQYLFKKINDEWKVLSANESGIEKYIEANPTGL